MKALLAIVLLAIAGGNARADCKCRAAGQYFVHDQVICMQGKLARCGMSLNNSSWTIIAEACPQSMLPAPPKKLAVLTPLPPIK